MKKIIFFSSTRADFGLLSKLIKKVQSKSKNTKVIVFGNHFLKKFGYSFNEIKESKLKNIIKVYTFSSKTDDENIIKNFSKTIIKIGKKLNNLKPSIIVLLGDRYETLAVAISAMLNRIPIAHIAGGELTAGAFDDSIRHSISKMAHIHFTSHQAYKNRLIQLGENKNRIFNYGGLGVANIKKSKLMKKKQVLNELGITPKDKYVVITFHPITLDKNRSTQYFLNLLACLEKFKTIYKIFTFPNSDNESDQLIKALVKFKKKNNNVLIYKSLGQIKYFSVLKFSLGLIGNSSSGILEAPSFKVPVLNIGDRQKGRIMSKNIINSNYSIKKINRSLKKFFSKSFRKSLLKYNNIFYKKNTIEKTAEKILSLKNIDIKKNFFDIKL